MNSERVTPERPTSSLFSLNWLLIGIPLALLSKLAGWSDLAVFAFSAIAIIPLSDLIGDATETLAERTSEQIGSLLNATLGNAAELIITLFALNAGLVELVRASLIGSILGNLLLVMGMSILYGGMRHGVQKFDQRAASSNTTLVILAFLALAIPSIFDPAVLGTAASANPQRELLFSVGIAAVMIVLYGANLLFVFRRPTPANGITSGGVPLLPDDVPTEPKRVVSAADIRNAIIILIGSTIAIAVMSELLVSTVEPVVKQLGLSEFFVGIIFIPIIGNVAEHIVAVQFAGQNRMDLSLGISLGSSLQIALFVMPVLVFISLLFPNHLLLVFNRYELLALATASIAVMLVSQDGESNWLEGAELLAVYIILALAFYAVPAAL